MDAFSMGELKEEKDEKSIYNPSFGFAGNI